MLKALVIGKDGRTDALAECLRAGNAAVFGLSDVASPRLRHKSQCFLQGRTDDPSTVLQFASRVRPDFAVIGPEGPLAAGVVDALEDQLGIPCVGPRRSLARVESSKAFTRGLMTKYGIQGNVEHRVFKSMGGVRDYLRELQEFVIKPDGLTGGKGVKVFGDHLASIEEGVAYAQQLARDEQFVVEERLEGEEFSLQSFCDGEHIVDTIPVQDHKRAFEGDAGPNTGGMGSYSCEDHGLPFLSEEDVRIASAINAAVFRALREETGRPYRGVLYGGFMLTAQGVRLLEYNARLGDPEALNVLPILDTDFVELCQAIITGSLDRLAVRFRQKATVCKYVVPKNYPMNPVRGKVIDLECVPDASERLKIYFAGVEECEGKLLLTGSRAVAFVGIGDSLPEAEQIAEDAASRVEGPVEHRKDIGTSKLLQERRDHIKRLRAR